jgi:hypothetical protein
MPHVSLTRRQMLAGTGACLVGTALHASSPTTAPTEFFVSPTGSDTPGHGTKSRPFQSLTYAAAQISAPGSTIRLAPGNYAVSGTIPIASGVSVIGTGADQTILTGSHDGPLLDLDGGKGDQTLSGFKIDGREKKLTYGINIGRSDVKVHRIAAENTLAAAIHIGGGDVLTGIQISECNLKNCAHFDGAQHTGSIWMWNLESCDFFDNTIYETDGYGIKAVGSDGDMRRCKVYRNNIEINLAHEIKGWAPFGIEIWNVAERVLIYENKIKGGISLTGEGRKEGADRTVIMHDNLLDLRGKDSVGFEIHNNTDAEFYRNVVVHPNGAGGFLVMDSPNGLDRPADSNLHIHHNVIIGDPDMSRRDNVGHVGIWFYITRTCKDVFIYNNVFYGTTTGVDFTLGKIENVRVINNIFMGWQQVLRFGDGTASGLVVKNNVFWKDADIMADAKAKIPADAQISGNFVDQNPGLLLKGEELSLEYFAPASKSSFVLGKGIDVGSPVKEKTPNIGPMDLK